MDTDRVLTGLLVLAFWLAVDILLGLLIALRLARNASGSTAPATRRSTHPRYQSSGLSWLAFPPSGAGNLSKAASIGPDEMLLRPSPRYQESAARIRHFLR